MTHDTTPPRQSFFHLTQQLLTPLQQLHQRLLDLQKNDKEPNNAESILAITQAIHQLETARATLAQLLTVHTMTLFDEEYIHFCDLIVCGSKMAECLISKHGSSKIARQHALYWQRLAKEFKPFLKGVLNYYN